MHLVPVRNVTAALLHLAALPAALNGNVYQVSSDDDPANTFQDIEEMLLRSLGLEPRKLPPFSLPPPVLTLALKLLGRSETDTTRLYDSTKLRATNFTPVDSLAEAVREFGENLRLQVSAQWE